MFNEIDLYLLDRWDDVVKLEDAVEKLKGTHQELIDEAILKITEECKGWSEDEFIVRPYPEKRARQIYVYKKSWIFGKEKDWGLIGLGIENIDINGIIGEDKPYVCIWTESVKMLGIDLENFNATLLKELKDMSSSLEIENWGSSIGFYFPQSQKELLEAMKKGKPFIDILITQFNTLSKFIDPIDKTIEKYRRK